MNNIKNENRNISNKSQKIYLYYNKVKQKKR